MWSGVGSVVVFLPQVLLLFLFIGILEDSGYLARAALIADRTMAKVGLQGKSFIPLLSAYACAVPAIMATRTIENKRDRIATILIAPFMTCSARLPVYTLIIAAFLPKRPLLGRLLPTQARRRCWGCTCWDSWRRWSTARAAEIVRPEERAHAVSAGDAVLPLAHGAIPRPAPARPLQGLPAARRHGDSAGHGGALGHGATCRSSTASRRTSSTAWPARSGTPSSRSIKPLGFNWKIGIGLITSLAARETIIGTLGAIYGMDPESHKQELGNALHHDLTPGGAVALLVFFAFAMQCISTIAVVRRETGGWKWPALQFAYMRALAYAGAFLAAHVIR